MSPRERCGDSNSRLRAVAIAIRLRETRSGALIGDGELANEAVM